MGENGNLEYKICFDLVENLEEYKSKPNYLGSVSYEGNYYAITFVEGSSIKKAKDLIKYLLPAFKDVCYASLKTDGRPIASFEISHNHDPHEHLKN